ncbi:phage baseplate assembly protein V [Acidisoma cellulosilytica]|uniref:Phage baseplate assembly protein V n=1 Tax=Acidisoma cellulosilyticum TaxID=2802395 RepID=A0A963Z223_9PROT|nr:phage baseplate assembly protein V [Acidisoma cellulosilyticum]MCB8880418.1 phage baseplate assembly protein V [Acidisoma cellulosilyticum]
MMEAWTNAMRAQASAISGTAGQLRCGLIQSVDPASYCVRVTLQPEGVLSGWLPVASQWTGSGWGMVALPSPGQQVVVLAQEGRAEHGIVLGSLFSLQALPPNAPVGELWLVHASGSFLKLHNDGSIEGQAPVWNLTGTVRLQGDLLVSGDITDQNGTRGSLQQLRQIYDEHIHPGVQTGAGDTGLPIPQA